MRAIFHGLIVACLLIGLARAQEAEGIGTPQAAFAGGPIRLSKGAAGLLRTHYQGDKVPVIPQPFRGRLDTALAARDWSRVEAAKKDLLASGGLTAVLAWEQSRFIATGGLGIAELHALDIAAAGASELSETAAMLWLYSAAVTLTDGHKCADPAVKEAHLDRLRGPAFEPVLKHLRALRDDRAVAMRDLAVRLETVLSAERNDDTMCRARGVKPDLKPDAIWRREATATREMLPKHMAALLSVMRPKTPPTAAKSTARRPAARKAAPEKPETAPPAASPPPAAAEPAAKP